jgi:predicted kinase
MEAVIFMGIPGSGKSTFYRQRFIDTHIRINLDMLKTRHQELILFQACLAARQPFVVDNTNVTAVERSRYIPLARQAGFEVIGYYFHSSLKEAIKRNSQRTGKGKIPEKGVRGRYGLLQKPALAEGFDQLYSVRIDPATSRFIVDEWRIAAQ